MSVENDTLELNEFIKTFNFSNKVHTIHWETDLIKTSIKTRGSRRQNKKTLLRIVYKNLYDGIHPNDTLRVKWYSRLVDCVKKDVSSL